MTSRVRPRPWVYGEAELPLGLATAGSDGTNRGRPDPSEGRTYLGLSISRTRAGEYRVHLTTQGVGDRRVLTTLLAVGNLYTSTDKELLAVLHVVTAELEGRLEAGQAVD